MELKELKDIYQGEDIYVLGSGKSLSFIAAGFWTKKIVICVNATIELPQISSHIKYLYFVAKEPQESAQKAAKEKGAKIVTCPIHSGMGDKKNIILFPEITIMFEAKSNIIKDKNQVTRLERSSSTIITGMHLAVFMGAKNVLLVGHDGGTIDGKVHVENYNKENAVTSTGKYPKWFKSQKVTKKSIEFKKLLQQYWNVNVYSINPFINLGLEGHVYKEF